MLTLARLIVQAVAITLSNLRDRVMPTIALRAEIARLQRSLDTEQRRADALHEENQELMYMMDDATRTMRCAGRTIDRHITEAVKMESQIAWLQRRNAYLEACYRHRADVMAGVMLVGVVDAVQVDVP